MSTNSWGMLSFIGFHVIESNALVKLIEIRCLNSRDCSIICLSTKVCSMHDRLAGKPACCSRSVVSTAFFKRCIPLQLSHLERLPFFGRVTITPFFQSVGTEDDVQHVFSWVASFCICVSSGCLSSSAGISSRPTGLPFLRAFSAFFLNLQRGNRIQNNIEVRCRGERGFVKSDCWFGLV
jgi:hypothetical protein